MTVCSFKDSATEDETIGIYPYIKDIQVAPLPLVQGHTAAISVSTYENAVVSGSLTGHDFAFYQTGDHDVVAIQGIHAMQEPGLYPITLHVQLEDGSTFSYEQQVYVASGDFPQDPPLIVEPITLDPAVTKPEEDQVIAIISNITPTRQWSGTIHPAGGRALLY